jgi:adenylylsulfate kinase-like enzyme
LILISDYTPDKDRKMIHEAISFLAEKMLENEISLIVEGGSVEQESLNKKIKSLAEDKGAKIITVNIEAPVEVLRERFLKRLEKSAITGQKASVFDEEGFMKRVNAYFELKNSEDMTFDSSKEAPEFIAKSIMSIL